MNSKGATTPGKKAPPKVSKITRSMAHRIPSTSAFPERSRDEKLRQEAEKKKIGTLEKGAALAKEKKTEKKKEGPSRRKN